MGTSMIEAACTSTTIITQYHAATDARDAAGPDLSNEAYDALSDAVLSALHALATVPATTWAAHAAKMAVLAAERCAGCDLGPSEAFDALLEACLADAAALSVQ
jgi:hypothetical protein